MQLESVRLFFDSIRIAEHLYVGPQVLVAVLGWEQTSCGLKDWTSALLRTHSDCDVPAQRAELITRNDKPIFGDTIGPI
jgi:hypothetical protein